MKYLVIPSDIAVVNTYNREPMLDEKGKPVTVSFAEFIFGRLCDPIFGASMATILSAIKIRATVESESESEIAVIPIEDSDFALLKRAVETPSGAYDARVAPSLLPFFEAVTAASDKPPIKLAVASVASEEEQHQ